MIFMTFSKTFFYSFTRVCKFSFRELKIHISFGIFCIIFMTFSKTFLYPFIRVCKFSFSIISITKKQHVTLPHEITMTYKYTKLYWALHSYMYRSYWIFVQLSVVQLVQRQRGRGEVGGDGKDLLQLPDLCSWGGKKQTDKCVCRKIEDKLKTSRQQKLCSDVHGKKKKKVTPENEKVFHLVASSRQPRCTLVIWTLLPLVLDRCTIDNPQDRHVQAIIFKKK